MPTVGPPRVALATCRDLLQLDADSILLLDALRTSGRTQTQVVVWDDQGITWSDFDVILLRSVWDYHRRWNEFARWLQTMPPTINRRALVEWNADKRYLLHLAAKAVRVVPTIYLPPGSEPVFDLGADLVVKPAVSASAEDAYRCNPETAQMLIDRITGTGRTVLVQPYLNDVDIHGEVSLVFLDGQFSHAFRRAPRLVMDQERPLPSRSEPANASPRELAVARHAINVLPGTTSYARVDLLPGSNGQPLLSELELIEPGMRLDLAPEQAVDRLVRAVERQALRCQRQENTSPSRSSHDE